jgi:hypothetical protein
MAAWGALLATLVFTAGAAGAPREVPQEPTVVKGVVADGACAIHGMSAEQSQLLALQKARSSAIEQAAGVRVVSSTLVRDGMVAVDLIRSYSRGFIVAEKVEWLPLAQYQDSPARPPIPEYRVRITADVAVPKKTGRPPGLASTLNARLFRNGERASIEVRTERDANVAVFNITADDRVVLLFPNRMERGNLSVAGKPLRFPPEGSPVSLVMQTLPGHHRDAEAFFVVGMERDQEVDFLSIFENGRPLPLAAFFDRYAEIASLTEEIILPYAVEANQ